MQGRKASALEACLLRSIMSLSFLCKNQRSKTSGGWPSGRCSTALIRQVSVCRPATLISFWSKGLVRLKGPRPELGASLLCSSTTPQWNPTSKQATHAPPDRPTDPTQSGTARQEEVRPTCRSSSLSRPLSAPDLPFRLPDRLGLVISRLLSGLVVSALDAIGNYACLVVGSCSARVASPGTCLPDLLAPPSPRPSPNRQVLGL